jgi:hypothetical protein
LSTFSRGAYLSERHGLVADGRDGLFSNSVSGLLFAHCIA